MSALFLSSAGGDAHRVQAGQVLGLTAPTLVDGVTLFQRTLYLRIPLDDACDRLSLAAESALRLRFEPCTVTVRAGDDAWVKRWAGLGDEVQVGLTHPAPVMRVDSGLYNHAALHRLDGNAVSAAATIEGTTGTPLPTPFVGTAFEVRLTQERRVERLRFTSEEIAFQQAGHRSLSAAAVGVQAEQRVVEGLSSVDAAVKLRHGLTALTLAGAPGSPRLTLRSAYGAEVLWQWIEPGPQAGSVAFAAAKLADDWQLALERALSLVDQGGAPRPAVLVLPLDIASDSPCQVRLLEVAVTPLLERPLLAEPTTLRFGGAARQVQDIALERQARTRATVMQGRVGVAPGATSASGDTAAPHGAYLASGSSALVAVDLDSPLRCTAATFGWIPLGGTTALTVQLEVPSDTRPLAVAELDSDSAVAGLLCARWPAVDLQAATYRLRLMVRDGCGVLVATPDSEISLIVIDQAVTREVPLRPQVALLDAGEAEFPAEIFLNGAAVAVTGDAGGNFHGSLAGPPAAEHWNLSAGSSVPLTLTVESVRVSYTQA